MRKRFFEEADDNDKVYVVVEVHFLFKKLDLRK